MARALHVARDIWCALRRSCRVSPPPHDATLRWIRQQGDEARESAERLRQRRTVYTATGNVLADRYRGVHDDAGR